MSVNGRAYDWEDITVTLPHGEAAGITEISQKGAEVLLTMEQLDCAAVSGVCAEPSFQGRVYFSAGSVPRLRWKLKKGDDPLKTAQTFVGKYASFRAL